jgi:hypothetical protein
VAAWAVPSAPFTAPPIASVPTAWAPMPALPEALPVALPEALPDPRSDGVVPLRADWRISPPATD